MAHHASAKKRIRQTARQTAVNRARRSRLRGNLRKVEDAIRAGDKTLASEAYRAAQPELMRGHQRGVLHRNLVARKLARLSARIKAMEG
jgi:small subunit ribosomal protein S20